MYIQGECTVPLQITPVLGGTVTNYYVMTTQGGRLQ